LCKTDTQPMEYDIIKTEYVKNLKGFSAYFRIIAILAFIFMLLNYFGVDFFEGNQIVGITSICIIAIFFILEILNAILFMRIGVITFGNEKIIIDKDSTQSEFVLSNVQNVEISKIQSKHYLIQAHPVFEEAIELRENDLTKLRDYFTGNHIDFKHKSIQNWMKKIFGTK